MIGPAPWNASWTAEAPCELRPCRWAEGRLALWQPYAPGKGRPIFAQPHFVRQRRSVAEMRCTVCGERTEAGDRWWFGLGEARGGCWMTAEAPVHLACAHTALRLCPHLRALGRLPAPFPLGATVVAQMCGGAATERDFGVALHGRAVVGHLKLAWRQDDPRLIAAARLAAGSNDAAASLASVR